jgi:hypothetical protein
MGHEARPMVGGTRSRMRWGCLPSWTGVLLTRSPLHPGGARVPHPPSWVALRPPSARTRQQRGTGGASRTRPACHQSRSRSMAPRSMPWPWKGRTPGPDHAQGAGPATGADDSNDRPCRRPWGADRPPRPTDTCAASGSPSWSTPGTAPRSQGSSNPLDVEPCHPSAAELGRRGTRVGHERLLGRCGALSIHTSPGGLHPVEDPPAALPTSRGRTPRARALGLAVLLESLGRTLEGVAEGLLRQETGQRQGRFDRQSEGGLCA